MKYLYTSWSARIKNSLPLFRLLWRRLLVNKFKTSFKISSQSRKMSTPVIQATNLLQKHLELVGIGQVGQGDTGKNGKCGETSSSNQGVASLFFAALRWDFHFWLDGPNVGFSILVDWYSSFNEVLIEQSSFRCRNLVVDRRCEKTKLGSMQRSSVYAREVKFSAKEIGAIQIYLPKALTEAACMKRAARMQKRFIFVV